MLHLPIHLLLDIPFLEDLFLLYFPHEFSDSYLQFDQSAFIDEYLQWDDCRS